MLTRNSALIFFFILCLDACIERFEFAGSSPIAADLVVDGVITDEPGPYTIKLSKTIRVGSTLGGLMVPGATITLFSSAGESEVLTESTRLPGNYNTSGSGIIGVVGREYWIKINLPDGRMFESLPDKMFPTGKIDSVYHEFVTLTAENGSKSYGFKIFINARGPESDNKFTRWRFNGVFAVTTLPQFHPNAPPSNPCPTKPLPCSGYGYDDNGKLVVYEKCTYCKCWANQFEAKPLVTDGRLGNVVSKMQVGFVPVNYYTFQEMYQVTVTQMSLSKKAFEYFRTLQLQKEGATSLFQPAYATTEANNFVANGSGRILGLFYASSVSKKKLLIPKETNNAYLLAEVPMSCDARPGPAGESCLVLFPGSTNVKPKDWN